MSEKMYIGTKVIAAKEMDEDNFLHEVKGQPLPEGPKASRNGYQVRYADGYVSWSPKDVFEEAYRLISDDEKKLMASGQA